MIRHEGSKWILYTKDGSKVLGRFDSEKQAKDREREIQYFKHRHEQAAVEEAMAAKGVQFVIGRLKGETTTTVQTVIFDKDVFTKEQAVAWLKKNKLKSGKVDENDNSFRFRQREPGDFQDKSFKTITPGAKKEEYAGLPLRLLIDLWTITGHMDIREMVSAGLAGKEVSQP